MTELFIHQYIPQRLQQLGYANYHVRYRDLLIGAGSRQTITAYNELYFIVDDPQGLIVTSDYGMYDTSDTPLPDNEHQHRGEIVISNPGAENKRIKLIQVIIVN